jgi:hypothetical protein
VLNQLKQNAVSAIAGGAIQGLYDKWENYSTWAWKVTKPATHYN